MAVNTTYRGAGIFADTNFRQKLVTIIFCLFIASLFWILNALNNDYATIISYPLRFEYDKDKIKPLKEIPKSVDVSVNGYGWYLLMYTLGFNSDPIVVKPENLNANSFITSRSVLAMLKEKIPNVRINNFINDTLWFNYESIVTKNIFLKLDKGKLNLPRGATLVGHVRVIPSFITCSGPESVITTLPDSVYFSIPNTFVESDFDEMVEINYRPSPEVTRNIDQVRVSFNIKKLQ